MNLLEEVLTNSIVNADAYTIAGNCLVSEAAKERSVYYMANRYSPRKAWPEVAVDDRMVLWGLSTFVNTFMTNEVNAENLLDAVTFMAQAKVGCGALKFDHNMWNRVRTEYGGRLPIVIEGLPEGSVFYPHQPMIQVTSLAEGFGEIAAHIEAVMVGMVACATARATLTAQWREHIRQRMVKLGYTKAEADVMSVGYIHDFGMRASSTPQESLMYGLAHLLFFTGTDTFNAAFYAYKSGVKDAGKSILALAHRVVQSYEDESDAYSNLLAQDNIGSYVGDCYNYQRAVTRDLIPLALANPDKLIVARTDSGDDIENALFLCRNAEKAGLCKVGRFGLKEPTNLLMIEGNSVNPSSLDRREDAVIEAGYNPYAWGINGVGGYLRNTPNRDSLSSAFKLNAVGKNNRPVMKFSDVVTKESLPGPLELINGVCAKRPNIYSAPEIADRLKSDCKQRFVTYYHGGKIANWVGNYKDVYDRVQKCWDSAAPSMGRECIVAPLNDIIKQLRTKYKS